MQSNYLTAQTRAGSDARPLVLHVLHRMDTGGLENGVVNLINHMPDHTYRHAVLALTEVTDFCQRIQRRDVECIALRKPLGHGLWQYPRVFRLIRQLGPHIVHSRNLAALEMQVPAWAAGVPVRIHGEHGRDLSDQDGSNVSYQRLRRLYKPFVHHYLALSRDLDDYLVDRVRVPRDCVTQIYNGVDAACFYPAPYGPQPITGCPFNPQHHWLIGTVGRMQAIKDPLTLAQAFVQALSWAPELQHRIRLILVGEGPVRATVQALLEDAGMPHLAWLPGERRDVAHIMRGLHAFVLPSLSEGISNVILEAMASALPVIATDVGGNADLVASGTTGHLVPAADPHPMALRLLQWATHPELARAMGRAGRARALKSFSLQAMVTAYQSVYDRQLQRVSVAGRD